MHLDVVAMGSKMSAWVYEGVETYTQRMPPELKVQIIEVPLKTRSKLSDLKKCMEQEGEMMLKKVPDQNYCMVLDRCGTEWSTEDLALELKSWMQRGQNISLLIGGPEGLSKACLNRSDQKWSLSRLTFPHGLARVMVVEQLYRAWSIISHHPYHK